MSSRQRRMKRQNILKEAEMFMIGAGGLEKLKSGIYLAPGVLCYIGYSNSPDMAIITKVTDDVVFFTTRPYTKDRRDSRQSFEDMAIKGTERRLQQLSSSMFSGVDWVAQRKADFKLILAGKPPKELHKPRDFQSVKVVIQPTDDFEDAWREFESYFPNSIYSQNEKTGELVIYTNRKEGESWKRKLPRGFKFVSMKDDR